MKNTLLTIVLIASLGSCNSETATEDNTRYQELGELATQYMEQYNAHKWENLALLYAPSVELRLPLQEEGAVNLTQVDLVPILQNLERAYPDIRDSLVATHLSDGSIILELVSMGISPMGDTLHDHSCKVLKVDSTGHIIREYNY